MPPHSQKDWREVPESLVYHKKILNSPPSLIPLINTRSLRFLQHFHFVQYCQKKKKNSSTSYRKLKHVTKNHAVADKSLMKRCYLCTSEFYLMTQVSTKFQHKLIILFYSTKFAPKRAFPIENEISEDHLWIPHIRIGLISNSN